MHIKMPWGGFGFVNVGILNEELKSKGIQGIYRVLEDVESQFYVHDTQCENELDLIAILDNVGCQHETFHQRFILVPSVEIERLKGSLFVE